MACFRQCFVDALQPQHLSSSWQINHRYEASTHSQAIICRYPVRLATTLVHVSSIYNTNQTNQYLTYRAEGNSSL